jgi:type I restriction enzyme S subunit
MQNSNLQLKSKKFPSDSEMTKLDQVITDIIGGDWGKGESSEDSLLCRVLRGTDFAKAQDGFFDDVPTRFIRKKSFDKLKLEQGDILIELSGGSKDQPTGRVFIWRANLNKNSENIIFSNFVKKLKLDCLKVEPEYFYRYWQHLYFLGRTTKYEKRTTGIRNFKYRDFIENEKIPLPPLPEQRKIVYVLDSIQEAVRVQEKIIEKTKELKRSLMHKLFREGVPSFLKGKKLKKTEIGEIPENWEVVRLGDERFFKIILGGTPKTGTPEYWNGEIPWITPNDLSKITTVFIKNTERSITKKGLESGSTLLPSGSIILSTRAPIGYVGVLEKDMAFNQGCKGIVIKDKNNFFNLFVYYFLSIKSSKLYELGAGSTFRELSTNDLKNFKIPFPPLPEQREIAETLQTIDQKIEIEQKKKTLYEELFKTMLNKLMTGEIRVNNINFLL